MHSCYLQHAAQIDASNTNAQTTSQKQQAIQLNTNEIQPIHSQAHPDSDKHFTMASTTDKGKKRRYDTATADSHSCK
jgi:hypothetical protein